MTLTIAGFRFSMSIARVPSAAERRENPEISGAELERRADRGRTELHRMRVMSGLDGVIR